MKIGDLVTFGNQGNQVGVIVEDHTMLCSMGVDEPYLMGAMLVFANGKVERVVYANLRLAA